LHPDAKALVTIRPASGHNSLPFPDSALDQPLLNFGEGLSGESFVGEGLVKASVSRDLHRSLTDSKVIHSPSCDSPVTNHSWLPFGW
jgi:hypothetical protein